MNRSHGVVRQAAAFLREQQTPPAPMVVAVSGGPDSVALLRALLEVRSASPGVVVVAHLNHQLRGEESDADEAMVRRLVETVNQDGSLVLSCARLDVAAEAQRTRRNLEETARSLRYDWLAQVARAHGIDVVATGHTADDQAETVLHRLLRGAGLQGLRGIAPRRPLAPGIDLVRPLLQVSRAQVLEYLQSLGQPFCQDSSNRDTQRTRNRLRLQLLPLLEQDYNPAIRPLLCRLAQEAADVYQHQEAQARQLLSETERPRAAGVLVFDRAALAAAPRAIVREMLRLVWQRESWPMGEMTFDHWERAAELAQGTIRALELPGGVRGVRRQRVVQLQRIP